MFCPSQITTATPCAGKMVYDSVENETKQNVRHGEERGGNLTIPVSFSFVPPLRAVASNRKRNQQFDDKSNKLNLRESNAEANHFGTYALFSIRLDLYYFQVIKH